MSKNYIDINNSKVHEALYNFVNLEVLPNLKISEKEFWNGFIESANELTPVNRKLLKKRDEIPVFNDVSHFPPPISIPIHDSQCGILVFCNMEIP